MGESLTKFLDFRGIRHGESVQVSTASNLELDSLSATSLEDHTCKTVVKLLSKKNELEKKNLRLASFRRAVTMNSLISRICFGWKKDEKWLHETFPKKQLQHSSQKAHHCQTRREGKRKKEKAGRLNRPGIKVQTMFSGSVTFFEGFFGRLSCVIFFSCREHRTASLYFLFSLKKIFFRYVYEPKHFCFVPFWTSLLLSKFSFPFTSNPSFMLFDNFINRSNKRGFSFFVHFLPSFGNIYSSWISRDWRRY